MDFLDPRKKRAHRRRLLFGYVLFAIAIGLATIILVYGAYGYSVNTKTGDIVQNGLLFVDSHPSGANFSLNGKAQADKTSARLVLPAGRYNLKISKSGYRDWQRSFVLEEHNIERYVYPFLFPVKPVESIVKDYPQPLAIMSSSPDSHWLLVAGSASPTGDFSLDEFDTTDTAAPPVAISLPAGVMSAMSSGGSLKAVEWSSDNNYLLIKHEGGGTTEFILLNRKEPAKSVNLNKLFKLSPTLVSLRDKKVNQFYLYDQIAQTIQLGDLSTGVVDKPILTDVLAYKSYGSNLLIYVSDSDAKNGLVQARIWDNGKTYRLSNLTAGSIYLIDAAKFQGKFYFVAGSNSSDRINVFKDPSIASASPFITLHQSAASVVSFSDNARFIAAESGQSLVTYDLEESEYYHYSVKAPLAQDLTWMDGHRLIGSSEGSVYVMDYDGTNPQLISPTTWLGGGFFDQDYQHMFSIETATTGSGVSLKSVDMRAGSDLPTVKQ